MARTRPPRTQKHAAASTPSPRTGKTFQPIGLGRWSQVLGVAASVVIALFTFIIYGQTVQVPAIEYEDPFYLTHSPYVAINAPRARIGAVWTEPYFGNFHPLTTTTWLLDRAVSDKRVAFDAKPFRVTHLIYAVIGASLLILLYRRLGIPTVLAVLGALIYEIHPVHTEVVAWLSARKDLISLIFMILAFLAWLWARSAATPNSWRVRHAMIVLLVLFAVLSKPIAVITPALFIAFEFCSGPHVGVLHWRWAYRCDHPILTRAITLSFIFLAVLGISTLIFRNLLLRDAAHGSWLILVLIALTLLTLTLAPSSQELARTAIGNTSGLRVFAPPFVALSLVSGAGAAWTFWAQSQVGAIKGGLTLLPTLNLTSEAMLAYISRAFVPAYMSVSYTWSSFPDVSLKGLLGVAIVCALLWLALRLAGAPDRDLRLIAFGIFWFFIVLVPVSNLVPTSTKMADRYLFVPTVGAVLLVLALASFLINRGHVKQSVVCSVLAVVVAIYGIWSYKRTEVWCGKTTMWNGSPNPDLSIWTSAVETNPADAMALTNLSLALLRLDPPQTEDAIAHLSHALELSEANQSKIAGGTPLILSPIYERLGDAYLTEATRLETANPGSDAWHKKRESYSNSQKYFVNASASLSGFASSDARMFGRLAEAYEGEAQMDAVELASAPVDSRSSLIRERDRLRGESNEAIQQAQKILAGGRVSATDSNYRSVMLTRGNLVFRREAGATNEQKTAYYHQALSLYEEATTLFPDDPRPFLYQGLCHERLTGIAQSAEEKQNEFVLGEAALKEALRLNVISEEYNRSLPYRALASLYVHVNDYRSALDALKNAQRVNPAAESAQLERDIRSLEEYLGKTGPKR